MVYVFTVGIPTLPLEKWGKKLKQCAKRRKVMGLSDFDCAIPSSENHFLFVGCLFSFKNIKLAAASFSLLSCLYFRLYSADLALYAGDCR